MTVQWINYAIFWGAALVLISILAGILSKKIGLPILLTYLLLGIFAGKEGPGNIHFGNFSTAYLVGNLSLAIILFEGGLFTAKKHFEMALGPAFSLATIGVLITAVITGGAATLIMGLPWQEGLLIGAIMSSTDAAAVFSLLRNMELQLKEKIQATLEIESGVNDPIAIFLTILMVNTLATNETLSINKMLALLFQQMGLGSAMGLLGGHCLIWLTDNVKVPPAFYPLLALSGAITTFALTNLWGGSGFLAIYIIGFLIGNSQLRAKALIQQFHEGLAWLAQIGMFLMLGLLITPTKMLGIIFPAFIIALVLIFIARPIAVLICLTPFKYEKKTQLFIGSVGLRGAVPIILAVIPSVAELEHTIMYFEIAFCVVFISLLLQGSTVSWLARKLNLLQAKPNEPN